jgi:hypothetical protein
VIVERVDPSGEPVTALSMSREECQACWVSRADGDNEPSSYNQMRRDR